MLIEEGAFSSREFRFFLGYTGWDSGQLQAELQAGAWFVIKAEAGLVFPEDASALWKTALQHMGGPYALMVNFPIHPSVN